MDDLNAVFSADGSEFFFAVKLPVRGRHVMLTMKRERGRWSVPVAVHISVDTVKKHSYNSYKKIGVQNRVQLSYFIQNMQTKDRR